jgi:hypothetical protein
MISSLAAENAGIKVAIDLPTVNESLRQGTGLWAAFFLKFLIIELR